MPLFRAQNRRLLQAREKPFVREKELQQITEVNLEAIFGFKLISSEFSLVGLWIDTLAYNPETQSFVIIEYKRDKNFSVIDQGLSYLSLALRNKDSLILEYAKKTRSDLNRINIDWSQIKVIFLARSFTDYQQNATNFRDLPIEIWEVRRYDNNLILYDKIEPAGGSASIQSLSKSKKIQDISREVKSYSEEGHFKGRKKEKELYESLKEKIRLIDPQLFPHPTKVYIGFQLPENWRNIFTITVRVDKLILELLRSKPGDFKDPEKRIHYRENSFKFFNQHISWLDIKDEGDIEYAALILKRAYQRFIKEFGAA